MVWHTGTLKYSTYIIYLHNLQYLTYIRLQVIYIFTQRVIFRRSAESLEVKRNMCKKI